MWDGALEIADAVLYEGYVLYPYRRSSGKNRVRWQFGVLAPEPWIAAQGVPDSHSVAGSVESSFAQTECLLDGPADGTLTVRLRFLQLLDKAVQRETDDGRFEPVDELAADGRRHLSFEEARPHDIDVVVALGAGRHERTVEVAGERLTERIPGGRVVRTCWPLTARVCVSADRLSAPFPLTRVRVRVDNAVRDVAPGAARSVALRRSLLATHLLLTADHEFVSLLEPPEWATPGARGCRNVHTYPVLVGPPGSRRVLLSAPIILYDYARVAPESAGDLHDGGEIDEILTLRTLTLTDAEKEEARATDPRTAAIVDRVDTMPPELLSRLHGAVRSLRPTPQPRPEEDSVRVAGAAVGRGSQVILRPRGRKDAHDMFLAGRVATVAAVFVDMEGEKQVAVTVDDDPAAELHEWYGRYFYFSPDEVEPVGGHQ